MSTVNESIQINYNFINDGEENHQSANATAATTVLSSLLKELSSAGVNTQDTGGAKEAINDQLDKLVGSVGSFIQKSDVPETMGKQLFVELLVAVQQVQAMEAETSSDVSEVQGKVGEASTQSITDQYEQVQQEVYQDEHQPWWKKTLDFVVQVVVPVVLIVVGVATADPALVFAGVMMGVIEDTPLMSDLSNGIQDVLKDMGCSDGVAELVGGILTVVTVAVVTGGVGAMGAVEVGADEAVDAVADVADEELTDFASSSVDEVTEPSESKESGKKLSVNKKTITKFATMGGSMALSSEASTISEGLFSVVPISNPKAKKILEGLTTILLELVALVGMCAGGSMSTSSEGSSVISEGASKFTKGVSDLVTEKMPELVDFISDSASSATDYLSEKAPGTMDFLSKHMPTVTEAARYLKFSAALALGGSELGLAGYQYSQADNVEELGSSEASISSLGTAQDLGEATMKSNSDFQKSMTKMFNEMIKQVSNLGYSANSAADIMAMNS